MKPLTRFLAAHIHRDGSQGELVDACLWDDADAVIRELEAGRDAARAELRYLVEAWGCSTLDGGDIDRVRRLLDAAIDNARSKE